MALMDELSARLHRQDGARFNEEVLPLLSETSTPGPLTLTLTLAQALAPTLSLTLTLTLPLTLTRCCRCGEATGGPRRAGSK